MLMSFLGLQSEAESLQEWELEGPPHWLEVSHQAGGVARV